MTNELIFSVLNGEYVLPIILAAEASSQLYIVDGLQRSTTLMMFRYGGYRLTSSLEEPVIHYRAKALDSEGETELDGNGDIIWETRSFDIRHKTYEKLPEGKLSLEEVATCVPSIPIEELKEMEAKIMQLA